MASEEEVVEVVAPGSTTCRLLTWKVKGDNAQVFLDQPLAILEPVEGEPGKQFVVKSRCRVGILTKISTEGSFVQPKEVIGTVRFQCDHEVIVNGLCSVCSAIISKTQGQTSSGQYRPIVHHARNLVASEKAARDLAEDEIQRLLRSRKLVLVVDLDQTLIHTSMDHRIQPGIPDVYGFDMIESNRRRVLYHVRLRPHTREFLTAVREHFEMHVFTMGSRRYAESIAELLEHEVPSEKGKSLFSRRILSRDELLDHRSKAPNLRAMFAASDSMVVIIDDRIDVWENQPNVVKVDAYRFWRDVGDINSPPGDSPQLHSQPQRNPSTHGTPSSDQNATAISNQGRSEQATASEASAAPEETMEAPSSEIPVDQPSEAVSSSSLPVEDVVEANVAVVKDGTGMDKDSDTSSDSDSDSDSTTSDSEASGDNSVDSAAGPLADQGADSAPRLDDKDCAIESSDDQLQSSGGSDDSLSSAFGKAEEEGLRRVQEQHDNEEAARAVAVAAAAEAAAVTDGPAQTEHGDASPKPAGYTDRDDYLLHLKSILCRVHGMFFEAQEAHPDALPSTRHLLPELRSRTLRGVHLVFSGVIPTDCPWPEQHEAWRTAVSLGAVVQPSLTDNAARPTTHLVAAKYGTHKVHTALAMMNVKVVSTEWLWTCARKWELAPEGDFALSKEFKGRDFPRSANPGKRARRPDNSAGHHSHHHRQPHQQHHQQQQRHQPHPPTMNAHGSGLQSHAKSHVQPVAAPIQRHMSITEADRDALLADFEDGMTTSSDEPDGDLPNSGDVPPVAPRKRPHESESSGQSSTSSASSTSDNDGTASSDGSDDAMASLLDQEIS